MWICEVSGANIVGEVMNEAGHRICDQFPPSLEKMCPMFMDILEVEVLC